MLRLAAENAKQHQVEDMTETGEALLVQVLCNLVLEDDYYQVKITKEKMAKLFDEEQKWLTTRWVSSALRRLGFKEKRRLGTGYEYRLTKRDVEDLALRMGIEKQEQSLEEKLSEIKQWIGLNKDADDLVDVFALTEHVKSLTEDDPSRIIDILKRDGQLFDVNKVGRLGVK